MVMRVFIESNKMCPEEVMPRGTVYLTEKAKAEVRNAYVSLKQMR